MAAASGVVAAGDLPPLRAELSDSRTTDSGQPAPVTRAIFQGGPIRNSIRLTSHGEPAEGLRWRKPEQAAEPLTDKPALQWTERGGAAGHSAGPAVSQARSPGTRAQSGRELEPIGRPAVSRPTTDPFDDPFGDRESAVQAPAGGARPAEGDPQPIDPFGDRNQPMPAEPMPAQPMPADPMPAPSDDAESMPHGLTPAPAPADGLLSDGDDGDRENYYLPGRITEADCSDSKCHYASTHSIRQVSLDLQPRFSPGDSDKEETTKQTRLAAAPSRVWRDRDGRVVADGRIVELDRGMLTLQSSDGAEVTIEVHALSDADHCELAKLWRMPLRCRIQETSVKPRKWTPMTYTWAASGLCNKPLYFENPQLERYGHSAGPILQPILSGAHFFGNIAVLPYKMGIHPPHECVYELGHYRVGSCAPWLVPPVPISLRGGLLQAGAVTGGVLLIP